MFTKLARLTPLAMLAFALGDAAIAQTCSGTLRQIRDVASSYSRSDDSAAALEKFAAEKLDGVTRGGTTDTCSSTVYDVKESAQMRRALENKDLREELEDIMRR